MFVFSFPWFSRNVFCLTLQGPDYPRLCSQGGGTQILGSDLCVWASGERQSSSVHTNCTSLCLPWFICQELMGAVKDFTYWVLSFENRTSFSG